MTVGELIEQLQKLNAPNKEVSVSFDAGNARTNITRILEYKGEQTFIDARGDKMFLMCFYDEDVNTAVVLICD